MHFIGYLIIDGISRLFYYRMTFENKMVIVNPEKLIFVVVTYFSLFQLLVCLAQ